MDFAHVRPCIDFLSDHFLKKHLEFWKLLHGGVKTLRRNSICNGCFLELFALQLLIWKVLPYHKRTLHNWIRSGSLLDFGVFNTNQLGTFTHTPKQHAASWLAAKEHPHRCPRKYQNHRHRICSADCVDTKDLDEFCGFKKPWMTILGQRDV